MKKATIRIAGRDVPVAYCYATEVTFAELTGISVQEYLQQSSEGAVADARKTVHLILSAALAAAQGEEKDTPIDFREIMFAASPGEIADAVTTIVNLCTDWYKLPFGEDATPAAEDCGKN